MVLLDPPFTAVYRGLWGVNGLLSVYAVSVHSFVLSWHSVAAGAACAVLTAGLQAAIAPPLKTVGNAHGTRAGGYQEMAPLPTPCVLH